MTIIQSRYGRHRSRSGTSGRRKGAILLLVLVVVPILALGAYAFNHFMRSEARSALTGRQQRQAHWLAESGIELALAVLADPASYDPAEIDLSNAPEVFGEQSVSSENDGGRGLVSVVLPTDGGVQYGLENESAKIPLHNTNLNLTRYGLMGLANMTEEIADAIVDWIDADDNQNALGAESQYYLLQSPPYAPRNGTPESIGELLLVKGVTQALLYGEDVNLDGVLDSNENDGDASWPPDNQDGVLDRGWYPYLTLHSADAIVNRKGEARIYLNVDVSDASAMEELRSKLTALFDAELANFVIEWRKTNGSIDCISDLIDGQVPNQQNPAKQPGRGPTTPPAAPARVGAAQPIQATPTATTPQNTAPGLQPAPRESPWTRKNVGEYFELALEELSVDDVKKKTGLIDVSRAPAAVLRALPNMTEELADEIETLAKSRSIESPTAAWLLKDGVVDPQQFRDLEKFVTGSGRVFRVQAVGYFENGGPKARVAAIIDATGETPKVVERIDLTSRFAGR